MKPSIKSIVIALVLAISWCVGALSIPALALSSPSPEVPALVNPVSPNRHGEITLKNDGLLDLIIPETIKGITATAIGDHAFGGCTLIRTVTIPATIQKIGTGAFADCPYLQTIILEDRADLSDLELGSNWSGNAKLIFTESVVTAPSQELQGYLQTLTTAKAITTVDTSNLTQAKAAAQALQDAYAALDQTDCTDTLSSDYNEALTVLLQLIQAAEAAPNDNLVPSDVPAQAPSVQTSPDSKEAMTESTPAITPSKEAPDPHEPVLVQPDELPAPSESAISAPDEQPSTPESVTVPDESLLTNNDVVIPQPSSETKDASAVPVVENMQIE